MQLNHCTNIYGCFGAEMIMRGIPFVKLNIYTYLKHVQPKNFLNTLQSSSNIHYVDKSLWTLGHNTHESFKHPISEFTLLLL